MNLHYSPSQSSQGGVPRSVALMGVTGLRNRGVEALVDTIIEQLQARWPGQKITVLSGDPGYDRAMLPPTVNVVSDGARYFGLRKELRVPLGAALQARALMRGQAGATLQAQEAIREADIVVMSGGDILGSEYGTGFLRQQVATIAFAQALGKPTVFLAHSVGPFASQEDADLARPVLSRGSLITIRESFSRNYLIDKLGLPADRVALTADVAFLLEPSEPRRIDAILGLLGLPPGEYVTMAASEGITSFSSMRDGEAHDRAWLAAIRTVLDTTSHSVLLIPHVQDHRPENDDGRIAFRLMEKLDFHPRVRAAIGPYTAQDYKGLIARSRYLIGERMHACIAALSSGVPTITIGYSVKAQGIMAEMFGAQAERLRLLTPVTNFITPGVVEELIATLEGNMGTVRATLAKTAPLMKERARSNFDLMAPLVLGHAAVD